MNDAKGLKGLLLTQLEKRSADAGNRVRASAESLGRIAAELRGDEIGGALGIAPLLDRGVARLNEFGSYLESAGAERLVADFERVGRKNPWALATTGLVLGIASARVLKASGVRRHAMNDAATSADTTSLAGDANRRDGAYAETL